MSVSPPGTGLSREARTELLAAASATAVGALAEACLADAPEVTLLSGPEVGMVLLTVREPVAQHRFHVGEVLVCRAEVEHRTHLGWALRLGDDREATLAAAILDAEVEARGPRADAVLALCHETAEAATRAAVREWAELAPTVVEFDELD